MKQELKNVGYRYEHSLNPDRDALDVMTFELWELGNVDVVYYLCKELNKCFNENTMHELSCLYKAMGHGGCQPKGYHEVDVRNIYKEALKELSEYFKKDYINGYVVWLCDSAEEDYNSYCGYVCDENMSFQTFKSNISIWNKGLQLTMNEEDGNLFLYTEKEYLSSCIKY